MSLNEDDENKCEDDDETMSQNKILKELNDNFDKIIEKSKSFEEQIKSLKKREDLKSFGLIMITAINSENLNILK